MSPIGTIDKGMFEKAKDTIVGHNRISGVAFAGGGAVVGMGIVHNANNALAEGQGSWVRRVQKGAGYALAAGSVLVGGDLAITKGATLQSVLDMALNLFNKGSRTR